MFTTFKTAAVVASAVLAAHALIGAASFSALQTKADEAVMPVVVAERMEVRATKIVKMDRIEVSAKRADVKVALTQWNAVA